MDEVEQKFLGYQLADPELTELHELLKHAETRDNRLFKRYVNLSRRDDIPRDVLMSAGRECQPAKAYAALVGNASFFAAGFIEKQQRESEFPELGLANGHE